MALLLVKVFALCFLPGLKKRPGKAHVKKLMPCRLDYALKRCPGFWARARARSSPVHTWYVLKRACRGIWVKTSSLDFVSKKDQTTPTRLWQIQIMPRSQLSTESPGDFNPVKPMASLKTDGQAAFQSVGIECGGAIGSPSHPNLIISGSNLLDPAVDILTKSRCTRV